MIGLLGMAVRTAVIFLALLFCMRVLGKRQLGELELSELVVSVLAAEPNRFISNYEVGRICPNAESDFF